jgi:hypothetical protein
MLAGLPAEALMSTLSSPLPDALRLLDGTPVTTPDQWTAQRRGELLRLFADHMYGHVPPAPAHLKATVHGCDEHWLGGTATLKEVELTFAPDPVPPLHLLMAVPNRREGRVPVFVGLNFDGNHTLVESPVPAVPTAWMRDGSPAVVDHRATEAGRGTHLTTYPFADAVRRGYAMASLYYGEIVPDDPHATTGVRAAYPSYDWGCIAAWAWGLSRAVDYLVTDPAIDPEAIAVVGHSRNGKAAMVCGATDERVALTIPCQAGCGGTAPSRGLIGESVQRINTAFPHWFNADFKTYNEHTDRLPMDQHELLALCAPRPVLFTCADEDTWANPVGQFEMMQAATPVYELLGVEGLEASEPPADGHLVNSRLGYFVRSGKHAMDEREWPAFFAFADQWLRRSQRAAPVGPRPEVG